MARSSLLVGVTNNQRSSDSMLNSPERPA